MAKAKLHKRMSSVRRRTVKNPNATRARYCGGVTVERVDWRKVNQQRAATKQRARPVSMPSSSQRIADGLTRMRSRINPSSRARDDSRGIDLKKRTRRPAASRRCAELETTRGRFVEAV